MNKLYVVLLCLLATPFLLPAQTLSWHKRILTYNGFNASMCRLTPEGDHFLISTDRTIIQVDQLGAITNFLEISKMSLTTHSAIKKYAAGTNHPYFVMTNRTSLGSKEFRLTAYWPGQGFTHEITFIDSLGINTLPKPLIVEISDNSYLVFGRFFYRKVAYNPSSGFTEEWARPLTVSPIAMVQHNNLLILADEKGNLQALDAAGNQVWLYNHVVQFRALKLVSDGFLACGKNAANQAAVIKLNFDGTEAWSKTYPDAIFNDIIQTADGGLVVAGLSATNNMEMVKLDPAGAVLWSREYGDGSALGGGATVLELPDGGFLFLGRGKTNIHCIRTDPTGNAPDAERSLVNSRFLQNTGLQSDFLSSPTLFFDGYENIFLAKEDSIASTIFAYTPWIAGVAPDSTLHLAAGDFHPSVIKSDYRPGGAGIPAMDFNRVWATNRAEIRKLREDYRLDQNLDQPVPFDLLTWPGKGNPHFQYNLDFSPVITDPTLFPAPFVDANSDGLYNVYDGDYPVIKGDQMVWWMFTDDTLHSRTLGQPLVVDIQVAAYLYDCVQNQVVEKTLFVDYTLINQSENIYTDAYLGFFADPDLGCHLDDYIGTAPQADAWYVYNADDDDADCQGVQGFGNKIPVQSVSFLNQSLDHTMYYVNPSVGTPPQGSTDPDLSNEYYRYLQGRWRDGKPLTVGGTGHNPNSLDTTNYFFPANPADLQGWSMCTENLPYYDRRVVSSHGPFNFAPADTFVMQVAFTRHSDIPHPCPDIFGLVVPPLQQLKQWNTDDALDLNPPLAPVYLIASGQTINLNATTPGATYTWSTGSVEPIITVGAAGDFTVTITGATGCVQVENVLVQKTAGTGTPQQLPQWEIWPNPASSRLYINCPDCGSAPLQAVLYNAQGQLVRQFNGMTAPVTLELQTLQAGLYWLELRSEKGILGVERVVVGR